MTTEEGQLERKEEEQEEQEEQEMPDSNSSRKPLMGFQSFRLRTFVLSFVCGVIGTLFLAAFYEPVMKWQKKHLLEEYGFHYDPTTWFLDEEVGQEKQKPDEVQVEEEPSEEVENEKKVWTKTELKKKNVLRQGMSMWYLILRSAEEWQGSFGNCLLLVFLMGFIKGVQPLLNIYPFYLLFSGGIENENEKDNNDGETQADVIGEVEVTTTNSNNNGCSTKVKTEPDGTGEIIESDPDLRPTPIISSDNHNGNSNHQQNQSENQQASPPFLSLRGYASPIFSAAFGLNTIWHLSLVFGSYNVVVGFWVKTVTSICKR